MFTSPSQVLCTIFGFKIYFYGVILAFAILVGSFISDYLARKFFNLPKDIMFDLAVYLVIFGIIGARIYYCALNYEFYLRFPTEILALRHGGISIHGALIGGLTGLIIFAKKRKFSILKLCDVTVPGLILAQAIGRWGNFFNSEAFGYPTNLPWKLFIAPVYRPIPFQNYEYFHPTFLYESLLDFIVFGILLFLLHKPLFKKEGNLALIYLILYSVIRIFVEHFRIDSVAYIMRLPVATCVSLCIILVATLVFIRNNFGRKEK